MGGASAPAGANWLSAYRGAGRAATISARPCWPRGGRSSKKGGGVARPGRENFFRRTQPRARQYEQGNRALVRPLAKRLGAAHVTRANFSTGRRRVSLWFRPQPERPPAARGNAGGGPG